MDKEKFKGLMILIVPQLIEEIVKRDNIEEDEAIRSLYTSKLYAALEDEETKVWHYSPRMLYEMYHGEMTTGELEFPEEAA